MIVGEILVDIQKLAPPQLAYDWDNTGLNLGSMEANVRRLAVAWGPSRQALETCIEQQIDLLIVYRPLFNEPIKALRWDDAWNETIRRLIAAGTSVYVMHTSLDQALYGPTDVLADLLEMPEEREVLDPTKSEALFKIAVYTPPEALESVRNAMAEAGAGHIGNYSHCSFHTEGIGTFLPLPGSDPYSGEGIGKLAREKEIKIEMIVPEPVMIPVLRAMIEAHPYEEVAYDILPLVIPGTTFGNGRLIDLKDVTTVSELAGWVGQELGNPIIRVGGDANTMVDTVALFAGSGDELIRTAYDAGADVLITGDIGIDGFEVAERLDFPIIDVEVRKLMMPGIRAIYTSLQTLYAGRDVEILLLD